MTRCASAEQEFGIGAGAVEQDERGPRGYPIGTKRICVDTDFYAMFNRENVTLVDVREDPIVRVDVDAIVTEHARYPVDAIVFATGYDAVTGALARIDIRGRGGEALKAKWGRGRATILG